MVAEDKKEEPTIVEVKNVVVSLETLTFVQVLFKILKSEMKNSNGITISSEVKSIILKLLETEPNYFNDIEKTLVEIIKDNKINTNDIPNIITLIQKLYELLYKLKDPKMDGKNRCEVCSSIIKFLIRVLIEERIIKIDDEHKIEFKNDIYKLIDSFIGLVRLPKELKNKNCIQMIFGKK
jgi:hypothetical protein